MSHEAEQNTGEEFRTSDLALAAYFALTIRVIRIERQDPRKVVFCFANVPKMDALVEAFWADTTLVNPREYFEKIRELKARIYAES